MAARTIRKAVLPVAGLGTRFFPATKAQPKEMLPIVDKPLIQYAVEEAVASGIEFVILVTSEGKDALENHFDSDPELEHILESRGKTEELEIVRGLTQLATVWSVRQRYPRGLGHAIGCARPLVGEEPFAVLLPDDLFGDARPCLQQLIEVYQAHPGCVLATREVAPAEVERYGMLKVEPVNSPGRPEWRDRLFRVLDLVEKPKPDATPSRYAVVGRYVLEPEIFPLIDQTRPGVGGEIQLTDSLRAFAQARAVYAYCFEGSHYDVGHKLGFLRAQIEFGLKHPELAEAFQAYLKSLKR